MERVLQQVNFPATSTGTCGQDPMLLLFFFFFFNIDFFSYKQYFATFYVSYMSYSDT
jgi:hypothetical protein